ncbi:hypothetical protein Bca101_018974 [Brassica carinata]
MFAIGDALILEETKTLSTFGFMDSPTSPTQNPISLHADSIISSLLSFPVYSPIYISSSFDRELDASVQERHVDRTIELASLLLESAKRAFRKRASVYNTISWFLPPELTFEGWKRTQIPQACSLARPCGSDCDPSMVDGRFLSTLSRNPDFIGSRLKSLGLYNIREMNRSTSFDVLSVCTVGTVKASDLIEFVTNSPNLTSLRLIRFRLTDKVARLLAQSSRTLKYLNLSRSPTISGRFLRDLGNSCKESPLKTLIVRNCLKLQEKEVLELCNSLIKGNFKSIRHIYVSNNRGLVSDDGERTYKPKFPLEKLKEERSNVTLVADFPSPWSLKDDPVCHEEDDEELREIEMMEDDASSSDKESSDDESSSEDDLG